MEEHVNPWKPIYDMSRGIAARLPFLRQAAEHAGLGRVGTYLAERAVPAQPDRVYLETEILPALAATRPARVLFVGCRRYTRHYGQRFTAGGSEYHTTDIDPAARRWGERDRHVTGDVRNIHFHYPAGHFDLVLLNGVFGFGVDAEEPMNETLDALHQVLVPGGTLLVGWNRGLIADPCGLPRMQALFRHQAVPPLPARKAFADHIRHVYDLFRAV